jgi:hypothetical protein
MQPKRVAGTMLGTALVAAWLFAAVGNRAPLAPAQPGAGSPDAATAPLIADVHAQTERLRERLRNAPVPRQPVRNPFAFEARRSPNLAIAGADAGTVDETPVAASEEAPVLQLLGIAEERQAEGDVRRTAILSGLGEVFLVRAGETFADRFRVNTVGVDAVQIVDLQFGRSFTLALP